MTRLKSKLIASSLAVALLIAGVTPTVAHAEEVAGTNGTIDTQQTVQVPSAFVVTAEMLGGDVVVDIPESIVITPSVDGDGKLNANLTTTLTVGASGALYPTRNLKVGVAKSFSFYNTLNNSLDPINANMSNVNATGTPAFMGELTTADGAISLGSGTLKCYDGDSSTWTDNTTDPSVAEALIMTWTPKATTLGDGTVSFDVEANYQDIKYLGSYEAIIDFYITVANSIL